MGLYKLVELLIIFILITTNFCYTLSTPSNKWYPRDITSDQNLHSLLVSIDDRVRGMDNIRFSITRLEMTLTRMSSKIDSLESQLNNVQTSMNMKMRDVYEVLLKQDMQREQMVQRCETSHSRLLHNINMLESRFEESFKKVQGNSDVNLVKIENKLNDMVNRVVEINSTLDAVRSYNHKLEDKINSTQKEFIQHLKNTQQQLAKKDHLDKIENKINGLHSQLNKTEIMWTQNDSPKGTNLELNDIKYELRSEGQKIENKVSNMYSDVKKKISLLENAIQENIIRTNITQKELQEDLRQIYIDHRDNEGFLDIVVDKMLTIIQTKFNDLHRRIEINFQSLTSEQNDVSSTCRSMYDDASGYCSRIELILEKLLDTFFNKTSSLSRQNVDLLEALKGHNSQMIRTVSDAKNMVITLAEENSHDHKALDNSVQEMVKRADFITATVEEVQDQLDDINGTMFSTGYYLTDISQVNNNSKSPHIEDQTDAGNNNNKTIHAIEANYGNGVIKIITDDLIPRLDKRESIKDVNENLTEINLKSNGSNNNNLDTILYLNNALSTSKIRGIISSPNSNESNIESNVTNIGTDSEKENNSISDEISTELNKENISADDEYKETSLILSYINFIKGHMTKDKFLQCGYPGKSFTSIQEMIAYMKPLKRIRNEFLVELDKYDREESELENIGPRHDFSDNTNLEYEYSSDNL